METRLTEKDVLDFLNEWELFKKKKLKEEEKPRVIVSMSKWINDALIFGFNNTHPLVEIKLERLAELLIAESKGELRISNSDFISLKEVVDVYKTGIELYTEKELLQAEEDAFNAARDFNTPNLYNKYPTFQDYKNKK